MRIVESDQTFASMSDCAQALFEAEIVITKTAGIAGIYRAIRSNKKYKDLTFVAVQGTIDSHKVDLIGSSPIATTIEKVLDFTV